jgi:hypothetical protein
MKTKIKNQLIAFCILSLFVAPLVSSGAVTYGSDPVTATIKNFVTLIVTIVLAICAVMILAGGFIMLTSGGSPDKVGSGRSMILWAVIGMAIAALAWGLTALIGQQIVNI